MCLQILSSKHRLARGQAQETLDEPLSSVASWLCDLEQASVSHTGVRLLETPHHSPRKECGRRVEIARVCNSKPYKRRERRLEDPGHSPHPKSALRCHS